jgi:TolA-binding protein
MSNVDKKIIEELNRYNSINKYITEQETLAAPAPEAGLDVTADADTVATPEMDPTIGDTPTAEPEVIDVAQDSEVEKISDTGETETEEESTGELDITDLVNSQKTIEQKQTQYFDSMFQQLNQLQTKLSEMDGLVQKLNDIESKIEKYREKTPQEKLELRSYDSYPFNQKLSQFFDDKQDEMEMTGKNEYVLTSDEVEDINSNDIKNSFQPGSQRDEYKTSFKR